MRVVLESPLSRAHLLRRRVARLGLRAVAGQLAFMAAVYPLLRRRAGERIRQILEDSGLDDSPIPAPVVRVQSANSPEARMVLRQYAPDVVVVNGTRIIGRETLAAIDCPIINMHSGITPLYRGVHGGYWALAEGRADLVGTTVHLLEAGIDTGSVISRATFPVTESDSFATYPYLHTAAGLPLLLAAVRDALAGELAPRPENPELPSRLRHHPTAREYLSHRLRHGVR